MKHSSLAGLSLRDLEYVEAVAELRHFGQAAERCGVSQPALSEQVRKVEALLGIDLFERSKRRVALTASGAALLPQIERVLQEARHVLALGRQGAAGMAGPLHMGAIDTLGPYYLPYLLCLVRETLPGVIPRLTEARTTALVDGVRRGVLDLALIAEPVDNYGLVGEMVFFEPFLLAAPSGHPLASDTPIGLENLPPEDLLLLDEGHCLRDQALALCAHPTGVTRHATSLETLWQLVAAGEGYTLLPALMLAAREEIRRQVSCRALEPNAGREIWLGWRGSDPRQTVFTRLAARLRENRPTGTR